MANTQIAAQMYTVRDFTQTPKELAETFKKLKAAGYDAVQLSKIGPIDQRELKKMLDDNGLYACATHTGYDRILAEMDKVIDEHLMINCKYTAVGVPPAMRNKDGYHQFAIEATEVGRKMAERGVYLGVHNHTRELQKFGSRSGLEMIYEDSDPRYLKAEIDTYYIQHAGFDPAYWIRKVAGRIPLVHLKDMAVEEETPFDCEVGEGNMDWPHIIEACREAGVEWYIVEQDDCHGRDPFESLAISFRNLKAMGLN